MKNDITQFHETTFDEISIQSTTNGITFFINETYNQIYALRSVFRTLERLIIINLSVQSGSFSLFHISKDKRR